MPSNIGNPAFGLAGRSRQPERAHLRFGRDQRILLLYDRKCRLGLWRSNVCIDKRRAKPAAQCGDDSQQLIDDCERGARTMMLQTLLKKGRMLRCDAGAALVEFALFLPPLIFAWMGMIEVGRYMAYATLAQASARAGTEYGIINLMYAHDISNATSLGDERRAVSSVGVYGNVQVPLLGQRSAAADGVQLFEDRSSGK